jgi:hypothetical protein
VKINKLKSGKGKGDCVHQTTENINTEIAVHLMKCGRSKNNEMTLPVAIQQK